MSFFLCHIDYQYHEKSYNHLMIKSNLKKYFSFFENMLKFFCNFGDEELLSFDASSVLKKHILLQD
jgi:hypothetical protein